MQRRKLGKLKFEMKYYVIFGATFICKIRDLYWLIFHIFELVSDPSWGKVVFPHCNINLLYIVAVKKA